VPKKRGGIIGSSCISLKWNSKRVFSPSLLSAGTVNNVIQLHVKLNYIVSTSFFYNSISNAWQHIMNLHSCTRSFCALGAWRLALARLAVFEASRKKRGWDR
jgi:hypothetical protein